MLRNHQWNIKYNSDDGNLVNLFYIPALKDAKRYDRLTGYFKAESLALVARGIEGLVQNDGRMRLVVGCTLEQPEIDAIKKGACLRDLVERRLTSISLTPPDFASENALGLLAWMVSRGFLDVKIAVPCNAYGNPIPSDAIFHEKTGIVEDRNGNRIAWTGSLNETSAGWQHNWESISVYTNWNEPERVDSEDDGFTKIWFGKTKRAIVLDVPSAVCQDLMRFMPAPNDLPSQLKNTHLTDKLRSLSHQQSKSLSADLLRNQVWTFIQEAASWPSGERVGEATASVNPWPHQVKVLDRLYRNWPPRLLIADEVGLGKTIQAGLLLRQSWLAGRAKRVLILAPKAVLSQWQTELREKFNLNWPIYDGDKLTWYPSPAKRECHERKIGRDEWYREHFVITSSQLMRRTDRAETLLEKAEPWDLLVLAQV